MKKVFLAVIICLGSVMYSQAQEISSNALGIRTGDNNGLGIEISYQKALGDINRLELDLGFRDNKNYGVWKLTGIYQWVWDLGSNFNWYAGAGASVGSWNAKRITNTDDGMFVNLDGNIGVEYNFNIPLLVSLDFRPEFGLVGNLGNNDVDLDIALGLRYQF